MGLFKYIEDILANFLRIVRSVTIFDVLDILLLTFLIFALIKLMRETRAMQLLKGIFLLVLVFIVVKSFDLKVMGYLIDNFLQVGIIALIIVFQPELRRILEKVGRAKVSTLGGSSERTATDRDKAIAGIAEACARLHDSKTGALIVIERETRLGDIIEKETTSVINAECEPELFCNIFYNKAPLHDGAVIIRNFKIYAAGCFLPNTQKDQYLSTDLGSRHRAAVGMSENSDALVIVVSEETGNISVALDGQLSRDQTRESLITIMRKYMPGAFADKKKRRKNAK